MDGIKLRDDLNLLSKGDVLYSFDERSNNIIYIGKNAEGGIMSSAQAYNELYTQATMMLSILQDIFKDLRIEKPTTNGGAGNV
jgi:hypothetical protein